MKRKITDKLIEWKNHKNRKPLILHGARQVGKTYIINEFGKEYYSDIIYVNFEINSRIASDFNDDISPKFIINRLEMFFGKKIESSSTLIIFDEIQVCERALTSLKYFCEVAPEYHIIAAGSLLGVAINREKYSFPVGKVEMLTLFPMDFEEFLWANSKKILADEIRKNFIANETLDGFIHEHALELYKSYLVIGGMPDVVKAYITENRMIEAINIQRLILNTYIADMAKYTSHTEATKVMACYDSIPAQLEKDNKKFQYKVVRKGGKASLFGASLDWLSAAGIIKICEKIEHGYMPPEIYKSLFSFKVYMSDVGLLTQKSGIVPHDILSESNNRFIGAITENYVANALAANAFKLYYWESNSQAEVDFVIQNYNLVIPIEVKSDIHIKSRSLSVYIQKYSPEYSIRISAKNFGFANGIKSVPLYAVFCIEQNK
ncbi:MAG TPA: AAA family ATPase [Ruminiclostridium sp.]